VKPWSITPGELHDMLTTIPLFTRHRRATPDISLALDGALSGRHVRPRTPVNTCLKNAQIVAISRTPVPPYELPNRIHMSFRRSEIGSDQCISEEPRSLCDYPPRLSHDDYPPMFTCLIHPSAFIVTRHRSANPHPWRLHYFPQNRQKRFISITSTKPRTTDDSPSVSVSGIESCSDELILGDPEAAQIHATA